MPKRNRLLVVVSAIVVMFANVTSFEAQENSKPDKLWVYIGTYTQPNKSKGIYLFELDTATGKLSPKGLAGEVQNPSFIAIHPSKKYLYAAGEIANFNAKKEGAISAFAIDPATGTLKLLNQ